MLPRLWRSRIARVPRPESVRSRAPEERCVIVSGAERARLVPDRVSDAPSRVRVLFVPDEVPPIVFFPTVGAADPRYAVLFVVVAPEN